MLKHSDLSELTLSSDHDLAVKNPELIEEWHPTRNGDLTPDQVTPGSNRKVWWRCSRGHEWKAVVNDRTRGTGCPFCNRERRQCRNTVKNIKQLKNKGFQNTKQIPKAVVLAVLNRCSLPTPPLK
tara:strand:- start:95 stop:469 length:375 start_codon:yes stop_codon:yes gene_type:complete